MFDVFVSVCISHYDLCFCSYSLRFSCEQIFGRFHLRNNIFSVKFVLFLQTFPHIGLWLRLQFDDTTIICLFVILITQLFARYLPRRSSNQNRFVHTQLHTRLIEFLLTAALGFHMQTSSVWRRFLKCNFRGFAFSRILLRLPCSVMLVVVGLHVRCIC